MNSWLFDLELLLRLSAESNFRAEEIVLGKWVHVLDSKVKIKDSIAIVITVMKLRIKYGNLRNLEIISKV